LTKNMLRLKVSRDGELDSKKVSSLLIMHVKRTHFSSMKDT